MNKTLGIFRHETLTRLRKFSFLFASFGLPILGILGFLFFSQLNSDTTSTLSTFINGAAAQKPQGWVDASGVIQTIPSDLQNYLLPFENEAAAQAALQANQIEVYYLVPKDFLSSGEVVAVRPDFNPLSGLQTTGAFNYLINVNLLDGDESLASTLFLPLRTKSVSLAPEPERDQNNPLTFFMPYITTMVFYFLILTTASLMLSSISKEKENRVLEILLLSATPRQILNGKLLALGLLGLLQTAAWTGTSYLALRLSGRIFHLPPAFQLPPSFLAWGLIFFLLGYAVYASLMAGLGALVPNMREASQATMLVVMPLLVPLFVMNVLIEDPHGPVATALSLFPLTAPEVMMTRLASGGVPFWQPWAAAILLLGTIWLVMRTVAGMFQAQIMLSGQPFKVKHFVMALIGKAG